MRGLKRRIFLTVTVLGCAAAVAGFATFSAFSSTTANSGNSFEAGTVYISDNDSGSAMSSVSNKKPGESLSRCIKVTYTGSLDSTVKLYASSVGAVGQYITLLIETGTGSPTFRGPSAEGCTGFTADASPQLYNGTLKGFRRHVHQLLERPRGQPRRRGDQVGHQRRRRLQVHVYVVGQQQRERRGIRRALDWRAQLHVGGAEPVTAAS